MPVPPQGINLHANTHEAGGTDPLANPIAAAAIPSSVSGAEGVSDALTVDDTTTSATFVDSSLSITRTNVSGNLVLAIASLTVEHDQDQDVSTKLVMDGVDKAASKTHVHEAGAESNITLAGFCSGDGAAQIIKIQFHELGATTARLTADDPLANLSSTLIVIEIARGSF